MAQTLEVALRAALDRANPETRREARSDACSNALVARTLARYIDETYRSHDYGLNDLSELLREVRT